MKMWWRMVSLFAGVMVAAAVSRGEGEAVYETSFTDGVPGWQAVNNATITEVARRPGVKSLRIVQSKNEEADSAWLSPVIPNPGKPLRVSLWAADNYDTQKDHSYAAAFELVPCDAEGRLTANGGDWTFLPWEDKRQIPQFRHTLTVEGLLWKHYEAVKRVQGPFFRVRLCWPKDRMMGECYFGDLRVTVADDAPAASASALAPVDAPRRLTLEVSTPTSGNLFYHDDPLRFEFLVYAPDGTPVALPADAALHYTVTDYEHFFVAAGELPFAPAAPVAVGKRDAKRDRSKNLHVSAVLPDAAAREVGRYFVLDVRLAAGGETLAADAITYGVVDPRRTPPEALASSRFISFAEGGGFDNRESAHRGQSLVDKMGVSMVHDWDYSGWRKAQPEKGGPITVAPGPDFPKLVYCPNLEQIRGRKPNHPWGDMSRNIPDWALIDDPFHPGCKGFEPDDYIKYVVAFVRANRHRIVQVVPSGLERFIDVRTLDLQRKAYAAIKAEFPDLPVGMMVWGLPSNPRDVDLILNEKLYEVADFFNTHVYVASVDWGEWHRLQRELKKRGVERQLISTEFAPVGGADALHRARDILAANLSAHANNMYRITNFLMYVGNNDPVREAILRGEFPGDGFQWMQYVDRPRVGATVAPKNWRNGLYGQDYCGSSLMPMLHAMAFYNLVQAVECADFKLQFRPAERCVAFVYARDGRTVCYLMLSEPAPATTLQLGGATPYRMQDLYGRTDRVTPAGASLVTVTRDPLLLVFDREVPELYAAKTAAEILKPVTGGVALPEVARGASGTAVVTLPGVYDRSFEARIEATVDGRWPQVAPQTVAVAPGQEARVELPIRVAEERPAGVSTFTTRVYDGETLVSVLKQPFRVGERLSVRLRGRAMTPKTDPAVVLTVRSLADRPMSGTIRLANRYFGTGLEPDRLERPYAVAPRGVTEVVIPLPREQVRLATSYELRATLEDASGFSVTCENDVSFQACVKTRQPITVDGDLSDWRLDELLPIPYERWHRGPADPADFSGRFYSRWDDARLYFAAEISDSTPVAKGVNEVNWNDDNIQFCLYPWGWEMGEPLNTGYYREHLGPLAEGRAGILRVGHVPSGPSAATGAEIAVTRTATGWVYEWSYPKAAIHPLALEKGGAFRLSMSVWDQRKADKQDSRDWGTFSWLTFAGFNTSVNALPNLWRQFELVE